jgi:hypothetical protein
MYRSLLWCSPHQPTIEQLSSLEGELFYLKDVYPSLMERIVNCPDNRGELYELAEDLFMFSLGKYELVQPGGSPAFLFALGTVSVADDGARQGLWGILFDIRFAHSERVSEEAIQPDGSIKKISTFKHLGWIKM